MNKNKARLLSKLGWVAVKFTGEVVKNTAAILAAQSIMNTINKDKKESVPSENTKSVDQPSPHP